MNNTQAQAALSVPASTAADKGGRQVVEINGKKMSFAEIAALPREQKWPILKQLSEMNQLWAYQEWRINLNEVASQEADAMRESAEVARQEADAMRESAKVARQEATTLALKNLDMMSLKLSRWLKLNGADKSYLGYLKASKELAVYLVAKKLLDNPQNFAVE